MIRPLLTLCLTTLFAASMPAEEIGWNTQGIGQDAGPSTQATRTLVSPPQAKGKQVLEIALTGTAWSGSMLVWTNYNPTMPGSDPKHWTHLVLSLHLLGRTDDPLLMVAPICLGADGKTTTTGKFLKLADYDPKGEAQRGFAKVLIPLDAFSETGKRADLGGGIIGLHFGAMTQDREKSIAFQLVQVAFDKPK